MADMLPIAVATIKIKNATPNVPWYCLKNNGNSVIQKSRIRFPLSFLFL